MKTSRTKKKDIKRKWHLIDLKDKILGRVATQIATLLQGKDKVYYTPHLDCGDNVVCLNSDKVEVSGKKRKDKIYYRHSGYPGGLKSISFQEQLEKDSRKIIELAVKNMLPKNKLRQPRLRRLKVFKDDQHPFKDKFKEKK